MQAIVNEQLAVRRARLGRWANLIGFVTLITGFLSFHLWEQYLLAYALLIGGFFAFNVGKRNAMRWGRWALLPRPDQAIARALKGLDHKYQLYSYFPELPTDHVLLTPHGLVTLEARPYFGKITIRGDRWRRKTSLLAFAQYFAEGGLGSPTRDARRAAEELTTLLTERLGQVGESVPVDAAVVLTHPRINADLQEPSVPVVKLDDLRNWLRQQGDSRGRLSPVVYRQLTQVLHEIAPAAPVQPKKREKSAKSSHKLTAIGK